MMLDLQYLLAMHRCLEVTGLCRQGIRDKNLLMSAIAGQEWYSSPLEQLCSVSYSINRFHIFADGNKRTSYLVLQELGVNFDDTRLTEVILRYATDASLSKEQFLSDIKWCIVG